MLLSAVPLVCARRRMRERSSVRPLQAQKDKNSNHKPATADKAGKQKEEAETVSRFDPTDRAHIKLTPETLAKVAVLSQKDMKYEAYLGLLQIELVKLQHTIAVEGRKVAVIFEGRDAAGKGGVISRIAAPMSPRICRIAALPKPTEREAAQWYFQRWSAHLPGPGEMVLFDRSWYSRAGVEKVCGFATPEQVRAFYREAPLFEQSLVNAGVKVIKLWLEVSDEEQERRFQARLKRDFKRWKLSPMDLNARTKWVEYSRARDEMLDRTDHPAAPWWVVPSDDKRLAQLDVIQFILTQCSPYYNIPPPDLVLPPRESCKGYQPPPPSAWRFIPQVYKCETLEVPEAVMLAAAGLQVSTLAEAAAAAFKEDVRPSPER